MTVGGALERARVSLRTAEQLISMDPAGAANRLYNAGENLGIASILLTGGTVPKNHGKIWNEVRVLFQKGVMLQDYRDNLKTAYRLRLYGDCGEATGETFNAETVTKLLTALKKFQKE